ncbi:hypothetical protein XELAEV_18041549mg [Xenopus laevis]|uniref:Uncharacterized protein n=1 Tax=Xenopus laevis TaxID=8355 RepID=A0A974C284_XENLA|nr:hypothetical protein XELAEV_18041549mg [Xenopus laevis]
MRKYSAFSAKCREAEAKEHGACLGTGKHAVKSRVQVKSLEAKKRSEKKSLQRKVKALSAEGKCKSWEQHTESTSAITAWESGQDAGEGTSSSAICLASVSAMEETAIMEEAASLSTGEAVDGSCHGVQPAVSARDFAKLNEGSAPLKQHKGESVLVSDTIIKAIKAMEILQKRKVELNGTLMRQIESTGLASGESRTRVQLNKKLEEVEQDIAGTMDIIKPWEDFYQNKGHFGTMSGAIQVTSQTVKQMILDLNLGELTEPPKDRTDSGLLTECCQF